MKTSIKLFFLLFTFGLSLYSCSLEDEIVNENESELLSTDPPNKDDDPEID